jgi:peroxiredoxin
MNLQTLKVGSKAPAFDLTGVDGKKRGLDEYKDRKAVAVIFSSNHCPYAQAYEDRIVELQRDYASKGVQLIVINSNETKNFPEDDFPHMVKRAKDKKFNFPYLRDEDQSVAKAYGPARTPEVFLFDQDMVLRYHGAIDDNYQDPVKVKRRYMREALDDLLAGKPVRTKETAAVGCSIKWL